MGLEARQFLYTAAFRSLAGSTPERVQHLVETSREVARAIDDGLTKLAGMRARPEEIRRLLLDD